VAAEAHVTMRRRDRDAKARVPGARIKSSELERRERKS